MEDQDIGQDWPITIVAIVSAGIGGALGIVVSDLLGIESPGTFIVNFVAIAATIWVATVLIPRWV